MIQVGYQEDKSYTDKALFYLFNFEDILNLPDQELVEVLAETPPQTIGFAILKAGEEAHNRCLSKVTPQVAAQIRETFEISNVSLTQIGGAQMKMIQVARKLERKGTLKTKRIPA